MWNFLRTQTRDALYRGLVAAICLAQASLALQPAPVPAGEKISASSLHADFVVLKRAYETLHPGLYRYNTKAEMDANFIALQTELNHDQTLREAYLAFSTFTAKVKCGHSYPNFFNQPKSVVQALFQGQNRVPFYFRWLDGRMIVTRNFSEQPLLKAGTEVLTINGIAVDTIFARLMTISRADGSNDAKRVNNLEVAGAGDYEAFDVYFPLFFPQSSPRLELQVKELTSGKTAMLKVPALTYEQRLAPIKAGEEARHGRDEPLWQLTFLDQQTAYLKMATWAVYDSKWNWQAFLEKSFDQLVARGTANLVIDLRRNEGGSSVGDLILSRLVSKDVRLEQFQRLVRYRKVPDDLVPYLDTWDPSFKDWGDSAKDPQDGFYRLTKYDDPAGGDVIKATGHPFKGRVFVLVDASNSSATFEFEQALQQNKLGTLVGEPTGGSQRGINGGAFFFLRLPNSKIEIDVPLIGAFAPGEKPDAGLQPDILVQPRVQDIADGVDSELKAVRDRIGAAK